jgi:hypothetical protein
MFRLGPADRVSPIQDLAGTQGGNLEATTWGVCSARKDPEANASSCRWRDDSLFEVFPNICVYSQSLLRKYSKTDFAVLNR